MSRKILFKAKRLDDRTWIEGYYQQRHDSVSGQIEHLIFRSESPIVWEYAKIDPETLCQYTGVTDFFGEKIWENDIVEEIIGAHTGRLFKISYDVDAFCVDGHGVMLRVRNAKDKIKVVGNAIDNPEILEGKKELTEKHAYVMQHAIGLDHKKPYKRHGNLFYKPYRNRFNTYPENELWTDLEKAGMAEHVDSGREDSMVDFCVTRKGLDWLGKRLGVYIYEEKE